MSNKKQVALADNGHDPYSILAQGDFDFHTTAENGITFREWTTIEQWLEVTGKVVTAFERSHQTHCRSLFMLGDCLRFGEDKFGESYGQAIDNTRAVMRIKAKTVENAAFIANKIAPEIRRPDTLTLTHHEAVAMLEPTEQAELLEKAESEAMSTQALKAEVKARHPKPKSKAKKAREAAKDEVSESEALDCLERVLIFFTAEEDKLEFRQWGKVRHDKWAPGLREISNVARRCVIDRGRPKKGKKK